MMNHLLSALQVVLGGLIAIGTVCWVGAFVAAIRFRIGQRTQSRVRDSWPGVAILKPVCGLEKNLYENLSSACRQDYPEYQVVYSVQRPDDPALEVLLRIQREFGSDRAAVVVHSTEVGMNGKINNMAGALPHAKYDILVISDSDVYAPPGYLKVIVRPLVDDSTVGGVSTFFRGAHATTWYEKLEQLTLEVDHFAMAIFGQMIGIENFCFGASFALRRETLNRIGGLEGLGGYLVEDNEMGQRIVRAGLKLVAVPELVDTTIDLKSPAHFWQKMTYWDQNTRAAMPGVFAATLVVRIIPLALLLAVLRGFDAMSLTVLGAAISIRLVAASGVLALALRDYRALPSLWMIPFKDLISVVWFLRAFWTRTVVWRGVELGLTRDGRFIPLESRGAAE